MFKGFLAIALAVVSGIIVADVLIHPAGVAAASTGFTQVEKPAINGLLGTATGS